MNVKLKNNGLGSAIYQLGLTDEQMERYLLLLETKGNRSYLFEDDIYANLTREYLDCDVSGEALTDEKFANMMKEEKHLDFPMFGLVLLQKQVSIVRGSYQGLSITLIMVEMLEDWEQMD